MWLIVSAPVAMLIGAWGWSLLDRGRRLGWLLVGWAFAAPLAPPLLTLATWLILGDSSPRSGHEPWPYYASVATLSVGACVFATPFVLGFVGIVVPAGSHERPIPKRPHLP